MGKIDIVCGLITGAVSVLFYIGTLSFPKSDIGINPKVFPLVIIFATFALSMTLVVQGALKLRREKGPVEKTLPRGKTALKLLALAAGMMVYALTFEVLGYVIVTPALMALTMYLFGERKPLRILLVSALVTAALYLIFRGVFRVPLPRSIIW
jgi:putative tricarboxylic transport membrane protein